MISGPLRKIVLELAEIAEQKLLLDARYAKASKAAMRALKEGDHVFQLPDGRLVTLTIVGGHEYVEVDIFKPRRL